MQGFDSPSRLTGMSERLRNIDEKGVFERTGAIILGILGWSNTVRQEINKKTLPIRRKSSE